MQLGDTTTVESGEALVKPETDNELYCKLLRAVICYKREKATYEQYQAYKAQSAEITKGRLDAESEHTSPTLEAQKEVEELISRAEKVATERSIRLKKVQEEALIVGASIEEARWKVYESFRQQINTDPRSIVGEAGVKDQVTTTQSLVEDNPPTPENRITDSTEREELQKQTLRREDLQKERLRREELRRERAEREEFRKENPRRAELTSSRVINTKEGGIKCNRQVAAANQPSQEESSDILEGKRPEREVSAPWEQQEDIVLKEIYFPQREEVRLLSEEEEVTTLGPRSGDQNCQNLGFPLFKRR